MGGICEIDGIGSNHYDFDYPASSEIFTLDSSIENLQKVAIENALKAHDSVGGVALVRVTGMPIGLGEPMYHKLDGAIADAMMGLNAVKAVEIGDGVSASRSCGSHNNDPITSDGFTSNHSGGILGGISNGEDIIVKVYFKPTPSIFLKQQTVDIHNENQTYLLKGRHDPCVAIRGSIVCESMMALVLADMVLLNMGRRVEHLTTLYPKGK